MRDWIFENGWRYLGIEVALWAIFLMAYYFVGGAPLLMAFMAANLTIAFVNICLTIWNMVSM